MNKQLDVGLIGVGNMGRNHLRVLSMLKNVNLKFIYDLDKELLNQYSKQYEVKIAENLEEELKNVEAVVIVTPTFTHYDYIQLCAKHVKKIFVEKPLTDTLENTLIVEKLAKENSLNIQVGYIERFNPVIIELKKIVENNNVINIDFQRTNKISSRITDVDVITDLMVHDLDLALYLNGDYKSVNAYGLVENGMIVFARATIQHTNGTYSNILASRITEKRIRHINLTIDDKYVDCNLLQKEISIHKQSIDQKYGDINLLSTEETVFVSQQEALLTELISFATSEENTPNVDDSIKVLELVKEIQTQIMESSK